MSALLDGIAVLSIFDLINKQMFDNIRKTKIGGDYMNELIEKITRLLRKASVEDLELFLTFIETYLRKKK